MRPRDRFLAAIRRQPVDRVPMFDFLFQRPLFTEVIGRTPATYNARDAMDLTVALGLDGVWIPYGCFSGWTPERISENCARGDQTAGPCPRLSILKWMLVASVTFAISLPSASISRTICPFARPPMAGLQDICATASRLMVSRRVRAPIRAAASAASQPAWPAPITMMS